MTRSGRISTLLFGHGTDGDATTDHVDRRTTGTTSVICLHTVRATSRGSSRSLHRRGLQNYVRGSKCSGQTVKARAPDRRSQRRRPGGRVPAHSSSPGFAIWTHLLPRSPWPVGDVTPSSPCWPLSTGETARCRGASAADLASSESWPLAVAKSLPPRSGSPPEPSARSRRVSRELLDARDDLPKQRPCQATFGELLGARRARRHIRPTCDLQRDAATQNASPGCSRRNA